MDEYSWKMELEQCLLKNPPELKMATKLIQENIPQYLYRYCSFDNPDRIRQEFLEGNLRISSPLYFNDPFDSELSLNKDILNLEDVRARTLKTIEGVLKSKHIKLAEYDRSRIQLSDNLVGDIKTVLSHYTIPIKPDFDEILMNQLQGVTRLYKELIGLICFSSKFDSILMWSHYAHYHTGFCIRFEFTENSDVYKSLFPVVYRKSRPDTITKALKRDKLWTMLSVICKSSDWSYEYEWRSVFLNINQLRGIKTSETGSYINVLPYIKGVYLGANISPANEKIIIPMARQLNVSVYKMKLSDTEYKLSPIKIS